jgi:hypothetical protein
MADQPNKPTDKSARSAGDTDEDLQRELEREKREADTASGDVGSNKNVTGSSTWTTMPDNKKEDK